MHTNSNSVGNSVQNEVTQTTGPKNVKVRLVVGNDTVYEKSHKENETNIKVDFSGIGTVQVKLYVDDILKGTRQPNLNEVNTVTFE